MNYLETKTPAKISTKIKLFKPDANWKERQEKRGFMKCPNCKKLYYSIMITPLSYEIKELFMISNDKTDLTKTSNKKMLNFIESAIMHSGLAKNKIESRNILTKLYEDWLERAKEDVFMGDDNTQKFIEERITPDIQVGKCYDCGEAYPIKMFESNIEEKYVKTFTCPIDGTKVIEWSDNHSFQTDTLMCPSCGYYFDRGMEIFNHITESYPTIDHLRVKRTKEKTIIHIHPYTCNPEVLTDLLLIARELKYQVSISGYSSYNRDALEIVLVREHEHKEEA